MAFPEPSDPKPCRQTRRGLQAGYKNIMRSSSYRCPLGSRWLPPGTAPRAPSLTSPTRRRLTPELRGLVAAGLALVARLTASALPQGAAGLQKGSALLGSFTGRSEGTHKLKECRPYSTRSHPSSSEVLGTEQEHCWRYSPGLCSCPHP